MESIAGSAKLRYLNKKLARVTQSSSLRNTFHLLKKKSERLAKQKLALLLLSTEVGKKMHENKVRVIQSFQRQRIKCICLNKVS
jgi:hypothetical protein